jgi:hypothetical protein
MEVIMKNVKLTLLLIAAASVGPQLIAPVKDEVRVKDATELSKEELNAVTRPSDYCVYKSKEQKSET